MWNALARAAALVLGGALVLAAGCDQPRTDIFDEGAVVPVPVPEPGVAFSDVAGSPFEAEIRELAARGLLGGAGQGRFAPGECLRRADWAVMLAQGLRLPLGASCASARYGDVARDDPRCPAVAAASEAGYLAGDRAGDFKPDDALLRFQAVLSAGAGAGLVPADAAGKDGEPLVTAHLPPAWSRIPAWAKYGVAAATRDGLNPISEKLAPAEPYECTRREEGAGLLHRLLTRNRGE